MNVLNAQDAKKKRAAARRRQLAQMRADAKRIAGAGPHVTWAPAPGPAITVPLDKLPPRVRAIVEAAINFDAVVERADRDRSVRALEDAFAAGVALAGAMMGAVKR
jgi:hypothetical protein